MYTLLCAQRPCIEQFGDGEHGRLWPLTRALARRATVRRATAVGAARRIVLSQVEHAVGVPAQSVDVKRGGVRVVFYPLL